MQDMFSPRMVTVIAGEDGVSISGMKKLNLQKLNILPPEATKSIWERIDASKPEKHLCMTSDEDTVLFQSWAKGEGGYIDIPGDIIIHGNVSLVDFLLSIDTVDKEEQKEMEFRCRYVMFQDYKTSVVGAEQDDYAFVGVIMPVIPELEEFFMPVAVKKDDGKIYFGFLGLRDYDSEKAAKMMNPEVIEELLIEGRMYAETWYGIQYTLMKQKDREMPFALYQERHPE